LYLCSGKLLEVNCLPKPLPKKYNFVMITPKHILLIGDNSQAGNWGCQSTTASLKFLIQQKYPNSEITSIYWHSYRSDTPPNGWPDPRASISHKSSLRSLLRKALIKSGTYSIARTVKRSISPPALRQEGQSKDSVPQKVGEFDGAAIRMLNKEILPHELDLLKQCDSVLINGEGSIYPGSNRFARYPLFLMYVIKQYLKKPCSMVNHTVEVEDKEVESMIRLVYPLLDYVAVREPCSKRELERIGIKREIAVVPDALFAYQSDEDWIPTSALKQEIDFGKPYICLGDSSGLQRVSWNIPRVYTELIQRLQEICGQVILIDGNSKYSKVLGDLVKQLGVGYITVKNCSYIDLYHVFAKSELYISGRWHPSILCAKAGTPFVLWGANSHKSEGLQELFNYPSAVFDLAIIPELMEDMILEAKKIFTLRKEYGELLYRKSSNYAKQAHHNIKFHQD